MGMEMELVRDGVIALLMGLALAAPLHLLHRALLRAAGGCGAVLIVRAQGECDGLEQHVRALARLRRETGLVGTIVLMDCGLSDAGEQLCAILCRTEQDVVLCREGEIRKYIT